MPARFQLSAFVLLIVSTPVACSGEHSPSVAHEGTTDAAPGNDAGLSADELSLQPGATLTTEVLDNARATATVLDSGDIQIELRDPADILLAKGWLSPRDRVLSFTILRAIEGGGRRGEVRLVAFATDITLENANQALAAQWLAATDPERETRAYRPYAPGCHIGTVPVTTPGRAHCVQNCCAIFDQWSHLYQCDGVGFFLPERISPCVIGTELYVSCIATCGLMPVRESYGQHCLPGEHQCFDDRCGGLAGKLYCAQDCYSAPSECDVKPTGSLEFCNIDVGPQHSCQDGYQRKGYWAVDCDTTMSSCECEARSLKRCTDDRCAAGRDGYCGHVVEQDQLAPGLVNSFSCDPRDTLNPCCGGVGQPCCTSICEGTLNCVSGSCTACGGLGEKPCPTDAGKKCDDDLDFRGTGNCEKCGGTNKQCCSNSVQYQSAGNDPCPNSSPWTSGINNHQCIAGMCSDCGCTDCGPAGSACCPEGIYRRGELLADEPCWNNVSCTNGVCPPCGGEGQPCCPGGPPYDMTNYCYGTNDGGTYVDFTCQAGTCRRRPAPPPAPAAWAIVGSVKCGLGGYTTLKNVGGTTANAQVHINFIDCLGNVFGGTWETCQNVAPGGTCLFGSIGAVMHHQILVNGMPVASGSCGCPF